ncbi:hypothetical protein GCM10010178_17370 [Lentzea flava]|uniref:Uncharacterized protein n=1 Tax=Lentzea flava TaxID=103732 RepID=A0ABQ2UDV0_9PSEU|nr:hypothetical protein GCM10010178_17370 [Lentzea flava]
MWTERTHRSDDGRETAQDQHGCVVRRTGVPVAILCAVRMSWKYSRVSRLWIGNIGSRGDKGENFCAISRVRTEWPTTISRAAGKRYHRSASAETTPPERPPYAPASAPALPHSREEAAAPVGAEADGQAAPG